MAYPNLTINKTVDKSYVDINGIVTYTIQITNTGDTDAIDIILTDLIPQGANFIATSVYINFVNYPSLNPAFGIPLPNITINQTITVTFQATVVNIPTINPMSNVAQLDYQYIDAGTTVSGLLNSTVALTTISSALVATTKLAPDTTSIGSVITFTLNVTNKGSTTAINLILIDTIPPGTTYVANSTKIFGNTVPDSPFPPGINLNTLRPGNYYEVTFNVVVVSIPSTGDIRNVAFTSYDYFVDPSIITTIHSTSLSNTTITEFNGIAIIDNSAGGLNKSVDKSYATVGDILTYTIGLKNTGNTAALSVILTDTTPANTNFISNSVTLDGFTISGANPNSGITIGTLSAGSISTVTFKVTVNTLPTTGSIINSSSVSFHYYSTLPSVLINGYGNSNTVTTQINQASIDYASGGMTKTVTPIYADVGDTLTYTIGLKNIGNITATNIIFSDTIPIGTTFIANSLKVDGTTIPSINPQNGVNIGTLPSGSSTTVNFQVTVNTIPTINPIPNNSTVTFQYTVTVGSPPINSGGNSNTVYTTINTATISASKTVSSQYAKIGNILTYSIGLFNHGTTIATSVILKDTIPTGTTFVANSVKINGVTQNGADPSTGITIGTITAGNISTVTFQVTVTTIPTINPIPNNSTTTYKYTVNPSSLPLNFSINSNETTTQINQAIIDYSLGNGFNKTVSPPNAGIGDSLIYTLILKNTGNVAATTIILKDTIPAGTTFIPNSVIIDSFAQPGANPSTGITIPSLSAGGTSTISFNVLVNSLPSVNPLTNSATVNFQYLLNPSSLPVNDSGNSNIVSSNINGAIINFVKSASSYGEVGKTILYTLQLQNIGTTLAYGILLTDTIPTETSFVSNSLTIDGVTISGANPSTPVSIPTLPAGTTSTVTFLVNVTTLPTLNPIVNTAFLNYQYLVSPSSSPVSVSTISNGASTFISQKIANLSGITMVANYSYATCENMITCNVSIPNTGTLAALNVIVKSTIPNGCSFIPNSVRINGNVVPGLRPDTGISLGIISPGVTSTVSYQFIINC